MAEDMFRQGPLWVDSGYRGDSVRRTWLFINGSRAKTAALPKFVTKFNHLRATCLSYLGAGLFRKHEGVGLLFSGNADPTHPAPPHFKNGSLISTMHTILHRR